MAVVGTYLPHALQFHHQNSPQMDTTGQEKEGTITTDMAAQRGQRPQYEGTESIHDPRAADLSTMNVGPYWRR